MGGGATSRFSCHGGISGSRAPHICLTCQLFLAFQRVAIIAEYQWTLFEQPLHYLQNVPLFTKYTNFYQRLYRLALQARVYKAQVIMSEFEVGFPITVDPQFV
jgi:hypothetical protein